MKPIAPLFVLALASTALAQTVRSEDNFGSLVPTTYRSPLRDNVARMEGDTLTILISERSAANLAAGTQSQKNETNTVPVQRLPFLSGGGLLGTIFDGLRKGMSTGATSQMQSQGNATRTGNLTARMSATVKQVLPNGNLVIEGTRWVQVNKDTQILRLTGIVRPWDIRRDNTVPSELIADAKITNDGKGQISDRQRRGVLTRIVEWLF